jgi:hypothetical protein
VSVQSANAMNPTPTPSTATQTTVATTGESTPRGVRGRRFTAALRSAAFALGVLLAVPGQASAHGPVAPVATSYLAKVGSVPAGVSAKVVDGDLRMWLSVSPHITILVLDYRGVPYLRFSRSGVYVNHNSSMYYLNQTPVPGVPPASLIRKAPDWRQVSPSHSWEWHDGRLGALATVALTPGASYVGRWNIPVRVDGHLHQLSGPVWHANDPPLVWFWPMAVVLACLAAALRLKRPALDQQIARSLAIVLLAGIATAGAGHELHGRPTVSAAQLAVLTPIVLFVAYALIRVLLGRAGYYLLFTIGFTALWAGGILVPTLMHGYVLMAVPPFAARATSVLCLSGGVGLLVIVLRMVLHPAAYGLPGVLRQRQTKRSRILAG